MQRDPRQFNFRGESANNSYRYHNAVIGAFWGFVFMFGIVGFVVLIVLVTLAIQEHMSF